MFLGLSLIQAIKDYQQDSGLQYVYWSIGCFHTIVLSRII